MHSASKRSIDRDIRVLRYAFGNTLKGIDGEYNVPVCCGGAVVNPGDIVYGDVDGVIVAPADRFAELVEKAEAADRNEVEWRKNFAEGKYLDALINIDRLVEVLTEATGRLRKV